MALRLNERRGHFEQFKLDTKMRLNEEVLAQYGFTDNGVRGTGLRLNETMPISGCSSGIGGR